MLILVHHKIGRHLDDEVELDENDVMLLALMILDDDELE